MALGLSSMFLDAGKLYGLLTIVPLIILYLVRPKPKEKTIPSVSFFLRDMSSNNARSFFKTFTKDWLFWLQLLTLLLLALAMAKPFVMVPETALADHTVIVLDVSASMMTEKDGKTRFEEAKNIAIENLGRKNTIILARNIPQISKQEVSKDEAGDFLKTVEPVATSTAVYDASRAALDYAAEGTRILVISDFIETEVDSNINSVKRALIARGAIVEFISLANPANNVGIVDLVVKEDTTTVQVKNFFNEEKAVVLRVGNIEETMNLKPGESDVLTFSTPTGITTVEIDVNDDFELDNKAFISTPQNTQVRTLFITNDPDIEKTNIWIALKAIGENTHYDLTLEKAIPPKSINVDHDLVILKDFDTNKILPGVFRDIAKRVENDETAAIIMAQQGLFAYAAVDQILPVIYKGENKDGSDIFKPEPEVKVLTEEVNFGHVDYYYDAKPKSGTRVIASASADNASIVAMGIMGAGRVFYYGIFDDDIKIDGNTKSSTFKHDLFYPIFWKRAVDLVTNSLTVDTINQRTGRVLNLGKDKIKLPDGSVAQGTMALDKQGIYSYRDADIAVNLLHSKESDVSGNFVDKEFTEIETEVVEKDSPKPLTRHFIIFGLIILFLELLYTKMRGDM